MLNILGIGFGIRDALYIYMKTLKLITCNGVEFKEYLELNACCDHSDVDEDDMVCFICGEDLREEFMSEAFDHYKNSKYED